MNTIVLTCAGRSERYADWGGSKWRLTHPSGNIMAAEAVLAMGDLSGWRVVVAVNHGDWERYGARAVKHEFAVAGVECDVVDVGEPPTRAATVMSALAQAGDDGAVCVRDCDNALRFSLMPENAVAVGDMTQVGRLDPGARSYVDVDVDQRVVAAAERRLVTRWFSAGAYTFRDRKTADLLLAAAAELDGHMTDAVRAGLTAGETFYARPVSFYEDWGTGDEWARYRRLHRTVFVDVDGVLLESSHRSFGTTWGTAAPLVENCRVIRALHDSGRVCVVLTTSRPESQRGVVEGELRAAGVRWNQLIVGLPACSRVLVNDAVVCRGERTVDALEVVRDLDGSLAGLMGVLR